MDKDKICGQGLEQTVARFIVHSPGGTSGIQGFSPFELLYGRQPRGILDIIKEAWEEQESRVQVSVQYMLGLRKKLQTLGEFANSNLLKAQERQVHYYNQGAQLRTFKPGDQVLLLLPS